MTDAEQIATPERLFRLWSGNSYEWDALTDVEQQRWIRLHSTLTQQLADEKAKREEWLQRYEVACNTITTMQQERQQRASYDVLSGLSSFLGQGLGDASTSAENYDRRIREGIAHMLEVEAIRLATAKSDLARAIAERDEARKDAVEARREAAIAREPRRGFTRLAEKRVRELTEDRDSLRAKLSQAEADTKRLDWLEGMSKEKTFGIYPDERDGTWSIVGNPTDSYSGGIPIGEGATLRAAIDAALSAQEKEQG